MNKLPNSNHSQSDVAKADEPKSRWHFLGMNLPGSYNTSSEGCMSPIILVLAVVVCIIAAVLR